ncbi:MAG: glycosyltransferase family 4 protein [Pseudomonadota bacterium]
MDNPVRRIVIVSDYGDVRGGLEKVAIESALGLRAAGMDVVFFCGVAPVDPRLEKTGVKVVCLGLTDIASNPSRVNAMRTGLWNPAAAQRLNEVVRDTDDLSGTVVHVHGWTKSLSSAIGPVVTAQDLRHVFTMHEYFFACPNGGFFDYQKNTICRRVAMSRDCILTNCDSRHASHKAFRVLRQAVQKNIGKLPKNVRNVIRISALQNEVMRPYFDDKTKFFHVPNPAVSTQRAAVDVEGNDEFHFVGRLVETKGAVDFAKAAQAAGVKPVFIGDGPQREEIRNANPDARILGWQDPDQVLEHLRNARALVFPSLWYECQPLVPLEAIALGIPVVCGDWGAARECIADGETGLLISSVAPNGDFTSALKRLSDARYAAKLGAEAYRRYWQDPLTMDRHLTTLTDVYRQV